MDPPKNIITLRNKEGRVREVNRDIPIVKRQYRGRRLSVGVVEEQLSPNSIRTEQTKRKESEEDTLTGGDAHRDTAAVVPPAKGRIRDAAQIFRERVERPREEPRANPANVTKEVQGTHRIDVDDNPSISNWKPAGYYPSTGPATVITSEPVKSERNLGTRTRTGEQTPMSQYSTVPSNVLSHTTADNEGFIPVSRNRRNSEGKRTSKELSTQELESAAQKVQRMFTDMRLEFGLDESNRFVVAPRGESNIPLKEAVKKLNEELNNPPREGSRKSDKVEEENEDDQFSVFSTQTDSKSKAERKADRRAQKEEKRFQRRAEEIREWASASAVGLPISSGSLRVSGYDQESMSQDTKTPAKFKGKLPDPDNSFLITETWDWPSRLSPI
ncbi:hypothetical protein ACEPAF_8684 [Sanghuangporus sanghuang]